MANIEFQVWITAQRESFGEERPCEALKDLAVGLRECAWCSPIIALRYMQVSGFMPSCMLYLTFFTLQTTRTQNPTFRLSGTKKREFLQVLLAMLIKAAFGPYAEGYLFFLRV